MHARCNAALATGLMALLSAQGATAQSTATFPGRPVRFVVPFPPGGGTDLIARTIGQRLSEAWGQPVVTDNRPGAGTNIGTELVAKAPADGHTMLLASFAHGVNFALFRDPGYHPLESFEPVSLLAVSPNLLVVHPSVAVASVKELVAFARASPGKLNYASTGAGTSAHLAGELFKVMAGVDLTHVPYKGGGPALTALLAGEVQVLFPTVLAGLRHVEAGRLRGLAVTSAQRNKALPDVPTVAETIPGFECGPWYGVLVPARTPKTVVARMHRDIVATLRISEVQKRISQDGADVVGSNPAELRQHIGQEMRRWSRVVRDAKLKAD